ncbi:MAG: hypothetical protein IJ489_10160 [Clostridia bacterium]|nr:hypothetical protein [Clostridia bacterium]
MIISTKMMIDYATNLKDTGFHSHLSNESKNKLLDAAKLIYEVVQEELSIDIQKVSEEKRHSPPKRVFSKIEGCWVER